MKLYQILAKDHLEKSRKLKEYLMAEYWFGKNLIMGLCRKKKNNKLFLKSIF